MSKSETKAADKRRVSDLFSGEIALALGEHLVADHKLLHLQKQRCVE
jgi:hypothetical protein